ncbi:4'-phosphopantetheinyl transferase superfamily protein [Hymenobacter sp. RP-2-7]|uniref:4'-phosphopantetheinyl transferase superfamily protein n=1 Tax=Hymenobacter polaris TaxID=2682546 RepID=A0A7Y0ACI8_9BACT|nr:4'-phosphopantetheinyl transferase superfamily protein [Hymenobacter polaris]NML64818.1 4'-phosphopantetheinyl transferase superfamily protein [Hymenobacter polaris]
MTPGTITCAHLPAPAWGAAPATGPLGPGEVRVYRLEHAAGPAVAALAPHVLPPPELARAGRYLQAADRQRFLVVRAALRVLLGHLTGQLAAAVEFAQSATHKPQLRGNAQLHFSVSHTRRWALLAVATQPVGVDVEEISSTFDFTSVLDFSCSAAERQVIARSPHPYQQFYQLWTRKEAFVKATGQGIDEQFAAIPALDGCHQLTGAAGHDWLVSSFLVVPGFAAALAGPAPPALGPPQLATLPVAWLSAQLAP